MSTSDLTVTLVGWVGTEPKHYTGTGVTPFTSFRMANTRRYLDRATGTWTDGRTEWFTVKLWRQSALNAASSLRKGDPVLVHGRLSTEQWDGPDGPRTTLVLEALAIGPDLTFGRASFARTVHVGAAVPSDDADDPASGSGPEAAAAPDLGPDDPWATDGAIGEPTADTDDRTAVGAQGETDGDTDGDADGETDGDTDGDTSPRAGSARVRRGRSPATAAI